MRTNMKFIILFMGLLALSVFTPKQAEAQRGYVSFQVFYDALSPYGEWVDYPNLGYVWLPDAGPDFVPYSTEGQWIYSNYGWTWASNYDWGWAPFHYGRWDFDDNLGWFWLPDTEWGPAWVTWRSSEGYYGWEPMAPGITLSLSFGREYNSRRDHWIFVRDRDFERQDIYRYHVDYNDNDRIIRNSSIIDHTYVDRTRRTTYATGPAREDIQRATGRRINQVAIRETDRPGQVLNDRQMKLYRPQVNRNYNNEQKPAPARVTNLNEVRRPAERNSNGLPVNQTPGNNRRQTQPNQVSPQNNDNQRVRPAQPQNINAPDNNQRQQNRDRIYRRNANTFQPQQQAQPQPQPQQPQAQPQQERQQRQPQQQPQTQPQPQPQQQQAQPQPQRQQQQPQAQPQQERQQRQPQQQTQRQQPQQQKAAPANASRREQRRNAVKQEKVNRANKAKESPKDDGRR